MNLARTIAAVAAVFLIGPRLAQAEDWRIETGMMTPMDPSTREHLVTPFGMGLQIGGGVVDFTQDEIGEQTDVGGMWTARAVVGTRSIIAAEGAYVGSAQPIDALGLRGDTALLRTGLEANVRVNLPIVRAQWLIEPYAFGGVGWSHYNIVNEDRNTSNMRDADDVFNIPLGGGLSIGYERLSIDARFSFYPSFDEELLRTATGSTDEDAGLDNWNLSLLVGYEF